MIFDHIDHIIVITNEVRKLDAMLVNEASVCAPEIRISIIAPSWHSTLLPNRSAILIIFGKKGFKFRHAESTAGACLEHLAELFGAGEVSGLDSFDNGIDTHTEADTHDAETL